MKEIGNANCITCIILIFSVIKENKKNAQSYNNFWLHSNPCNIHLYLFSNITLESVLSVHLRMALLVRHLVISQKLKPLDENIMKHLYFTGIIICRLQFVRCIHHKHTKRYYYCVNCG